MKKVIFAGAMLSATLSLAGNYGINPPRFGTNPPKTGAPNDRIGIPQIQKPIPPARPGIGRFMESQILADKVLRKIEVKADRFATYEGRLSYLANTDKEVFDWLVELNQYLDSKGFQQQSDQKKEQEKFEARLLVEMVIKRSN
jgi:hypothetical protein